MSGSETEDWECPLCMEELDIDDRGFFPCECGYQICRFCHNRLSEDYGGRCPACRRLYSEQKPRWNPISPAQVAKIKNEKKAKERERREIENNSRRHLANVRVVQKNLVYVIGLPLSLASEEILRSHDYFGQFGRINKIVINRRQNGSNSHHPTVGVYVTYATREEATRAINAVDGSTLETRVLRATFGTTKYCSYYLRNIPCQNPGCMYLHEPGEEADSFTKEDLAANRANLRESHRGSFDNDNHDGASVRTASRSPNVSGGSGRVVVVSTNSAAGLHGGRSNSAGHGAAATHGTPTSSRVRKSSELNGSRPRSVDPHNETNTGSALPATASWASRAMAKKPAEPAAESSKTRKPESGPMTLRMIPTSRNKNSKGSGTSSRAKPATSEAATAPATSPSSQHHPVLQQMSRERKQQLRSQNSAQQKASESEAATVSTSAGKVSNKPGQKSVAKQVEEPAKDASKTQLEANGVPPHAAEDNAEPEAVGTALDKAPEAETPETEPKQPEDSAAQNNSLVTNPEPKADEPAQSANSAASAQSFQNLTDSLFAKLNAKVSTPTTNSSMPAYGEAPHLGYHPGLRAPGYAASSVDPLLFPTANDPSGPINRVGGPFDSRSSFSLFSGSQSSQWSGANSAGGGPQIQSPLASLLGDASIQDAAGPRQRSRWDFAHADEASAQAELQSVLGRQTVAGPVPGFGHQQLTLHGPVPTSFESSRDLGMFSTPVRNGYIGTADPWNSLQLQQQQQQQQLSLAQAPFPPPGFASRHSSGSLSTDPHAAIPPPPSQAAPGSSTLLSKLMSQRQPGNALSNDAGQLYSPPYAQQQQQQYQLQDPAILLSQMSTSSAGAPTSLAGDVSSQLQRSRTDPNVLNSLLARLQLGRSENETTQPPGMESPLAQQTSGFQQPVSSESGGFVDPAIMQVGRLNTRGSASPVKPPPGIVSPVLGDAGVQPTKMLPRSANSSGRSRFLNHFAADGNKAEPPAEEAAVNSAANQAGVPPNLPTTGLFGELLRRAKQDSASASAMPLAAAGQAPSADYSPGVAPDGGSFISGKLMLSDIERKLEAARREAQELQAQLSTVIGQNQSAMWALANGSMPQTSAAAAVPEASANTATSNATGLSFSAV
ncbi:transcriptional repressor general negative regulator of transcription subunit 4 [Coemansia sp. RSA 1821]|nr:transcriptional repressor general negative regulator of transcription subunit 4 [Coemansia sp. RSA 1821]